MRTSAKCISLASSRWRDVVGGAYLGQSQYTIGKRINSDSRIEARRVLSAPLRFLPMRLGSVFVSWWLKIQEPNGEKIEPKIIEAEGVEAVGGSVFDISA